MAGFIEYLLIIIIFVYSAIELILLILRLVMEESDKKSENVEKAQIENGLIKYQNGDTLQRERRYHARRNKAHLATQGTLESSEELADRSDYGDHSDSFSTLPVRTKLKAFEERQIKNSLLQTSPVSYLKNESPCDQEGEKFQEIQKVRTEIKKFNSGLYVKLPPIDHCDATPRTHIIAKEKETLDAEPNEYEKKAEMTNNNKEEKEEKDDYSCLVDCLYYSMQCCECNLM